MSHLNESPAYQSFDLASTPLCEGATLLEASAGTGKTYAIAGLYLRLLLELNLGVENILVVTFTEAATAELRERIRERLVSARRALITGETQDSLLTHLLAKADANPKASSRNAWLAQLQAAIETLDEASVFTIHGFCSRILKERAFDSCLHFDAELRPDIRDLEQEAIGNFWRRRFSPGTAFLVAYCLFRKQSHETFRNLFRTLQQHPDLTLLPPEDGLVPMDSPGVDIQTVDGKGDCWGTWSRLAEPLLGALQSIWLEERERLVSFFGDNCSWGNRPYNKEAEMLEHFSKLDALFDPHPVGASGDSKEDYETTPDNSIVLPEQIAALELFAIQNMRAAESKRRKKGSDGVPSHRFFDLCQELFETMDPWVGHILRAFVRETQEELARIKEREKCLAFEDLLLLLRRALRTSEDPFLTHSLRKKYPAVLIDEFQDTDPVQYEIFERLFLNNKTHLYLVGDPKQAIYAFRGADIFAYLKARSAVPENRRYSLDKNWRSEWGLVASVNGLFEHPSPFFLSDIPFHSVIPKAPVEQHPLIGKKERRGGLVAWYWDPDEKVGSKPARRRHLAQVVADEIVRLLHENLEIEGRAIRPDDFAVLVETHAQAEQIHRALARAGVPAVQQTRQGVFQTEDARELLQVLSAILNPGHTGWVRGALATRMLGWTAEALSVLGSDEAAWETVWEQLDRYRMQWEQRGFFAMWRQFVQREGVQDRLLTQLDGDRRLTNLLHLAELLHQQSVDRQLGSQALVDWLADRRVAWNADLDPDELLMRLESDDAAVRLVTIHRSKGLEYGIVFCPFLERGAELARGERPLFHDPENADRLTCDLRVDVDPGGVEIASCERLAENLRLTYVALTRARHRAHLVWTDDAGKGTSALSWLLDPPADFDPTDLVANFEQYKVWSKDRTPERVSGAMAAWEARVSAQRIALGLDAQVPTLTVSPLPEPVRAVWDVPERAEDRGGQARTFSGKIDREWTVASFSSLSSHSGTRPSWNASATLEPSREREVSQDEAIATSPPTQRVRDPFSGTRAGVCLHEIFESLDFTAAQEERHRRVAEMLRVHKLALPSVERRVCRWVDRALELPLKDGLRLCTVPKTDRLVELEFHLPLHRLTPESLHAVFSGSRWDPGKTEDGVDRPWTFQPCHGLLCGFIDVMIRHQGKYYLVDWKSNDLGEVASAYSLDNLEAAMVRSQYVLQYHLYTAAADLYLRRRDSSYSYAQDFGGVFYLFVRGLDPDRDHHGVFFDKPDPDLVSALQGVLLGPDSSACAAGEGKASS